MNRRNFIKRSMVTGAGVAVGMRAATFGGVARADYDPTTITATVGISKGTDRADNAYRSMQMFKNQIAKEIGDKRVVIKVNLVSDQIAAFTRPELVEGILEFLKSIGKKDVVIAESAAGGNTMNSFEYANYWPLARKYPVKIMDLNQEGFSYANIYAAGTETNTAQRRIRICKMYLNPNNYIISATPIKTHNTVLVTMCAKNIGMSVPYIDIGYNSGQGGANTNKEQPGTAIREKWYMHGTVGGSSYPPGDFQALNDNVYRMLAVYGIKPHLSVLDGFRGTQGQGPHQGTLIADPQLVVLTSKDWLAVDRIGLTLMGPGSNPTDLVTPSTFKILNHTLDGYPMPYPAVLNYCWQAGMGEWDDRKIRIIGDLGEMTGKALADTNPGGVIRQYTMGWTGSSFTGQMGMRISPRRVDGYGAIGDGIPIVNEVTA